MPGFMRYGWRIDVLLGVSFGLAQQLMLVAPAAIVYASTASPDSLLQKRAAIAARWMLGLPPIVFGLFHLIGHSRLRDHRPAVDAVWIFLGGVDRNRLHPGRNVQFAQELWMSWPPGFLR